MREPTYFVLLTLLGGPLHGYGIAKRAEALSEGRVRLAAGTLYGALDRLTDQGLISVDSEDLVNGRRRRYYRISQSGRQAVLAEVERMRSSVAVADNLSGGQAPAVAT
ncbi:MAG: PadR family transcriptional regulator [Actinomycetia bacterium]|nr:PadR family transcriptional regulator [Actinomycetes bacterium]MCP4222486.1 PadR family transcriptional regulator [Actinomycetes bacterium]